MKISFSPVRCEDRLAAHVAGDTLTINDEKFDFAPLSEGATLPPEAINSEWFVGSVERTNGEVCLTLVLPHGRDAPRETLFPVDVQVASGDVPIPPANAPAKDVEG